MLFATDKLEWGKLEWVLQIRDCCGICWRNLVYLKKISGLYYALLLEIKPFCGGSGETKYANR